MDENKWRDGYAEWLEGFSWQWFSTLTFRPGFSHYQGYWRMKKWIDSLRSELGTANFGFVAIPEYGVTGTNFHYHALVMGLENWHAAAREEWMRRWFKSSGEARITQFNPGSGGVRYILKHVGPHDGDTIQFELPSGAPMNKESGAQ